MTHLTVEQLLSLREPGLEPGVQTCRTHVEECSLCRAELDRLNQRVARLKALPTLRPGRDRFAAIRSVAATEQRAGRMRRLRRVVLGGLAMAASVTLAVVAFRRERGDRELVRASPELEQVMTRSRELERAIAGFDDDSQVVDGRTASLAESLEERLARVDRQIEVIDLMDGSVRQEEALRLWRERVGLLDALMDVHLTGGRYVGF